MKKHLIAFIHKPVLVTVLSLIIAGGVGAYEYQRIQTGPAYQFTAATSGTITNIGMADASSSLQHVALSFLSSGRVTSVDVKVGDQVTKGETLAALDPESTLGAVTQAQAAYAAAQANYDKVVNGATASAVDVSQTGVDTAQQNLNHLIQNSYTQVDSVIRTDIDDLYVDPDSNSPQFELAFYDASSNTNVTLTLTDVNQRLDLGNQRVDIGTLLSAWSTASMTGDDTSVQLTLADLTKVQTYLSNVSTGLNAIHYDSRYQPNIDKYKADVAAARSTVDGLITSIQNAQQALATAKANTAVVTSSARPEDIAAAKAQTDSALGALQIAQAAFNGRIITAPGDGTVTAVHFNPGEIASANVPAIELSGKAFTKDVAVMVPKNAIINQNGQNYVLVKDPQGNGVTQKEVTLGASDSQNVEILSGLSVGDMVALR